MTAATTGPLTRPVPFTRRASARLALALGLLGLAFGLILTFVVFHEQDRQPAQPITGPGIGESFEIPDFAGEDELRITVTGGERQNSLHAGGNVDQDFITLFVTYEALQANQSTGSQTWKAQANGVTKHGGVDVFLDLPMGQPKATEVNFYFLPPGEPVTITYEDIFTDGPAFTMVVAPMTSEP